MNQTNQQSPATTEKQAESGNKDNGIRGLIKDEHTEIKKTKNEIRQRIHKNTSQTGKGPGPAKAVGPGPLHSATGEQTPEDTDTASDKQETDRKQEQRLIDNSSAYRANGGENITSDLAQISQQSSHSVSSDLRKHILSLMTRKSIYPRESRRPKIPTQPPTNRKPTVRSRIG